MNNPYYMIKKEQKKLAKQIKENGSDYDRYQFRHKHIAYCELRGKTRTEIEIPREGNEPSERKIKEWKDLWNADIEAWREYREKTLCNIN